MKRKSRPVNFDVIIFLQFLNTHGTEIAPRSNIIGEDFKNHRFGHGFLLFIFLAKKTGLSPGQAQLSFGL
jgi:hypothetical protein